MFELYTLSDTVIIKPNDLVTGIEKKLIEELKKRYAGRII
jgi:DNA-directed RNA polymerase subunit E'/Rpb7